MLLFGLISCFILTSSGSSVLESGYDDLLGYIDADNVLQIFHEWKDLHKIKYDDLTTTWTKFKVFKANIETVFGLNKKYNGLAKFALTQFADLSKEEFSKFYLLPGISTFFNRTLPLKSYQGPGTVSGDYAKEIDWTTKGVVTSVKNQGHVGTCYIFSTLGMLESRLAMKGKKLVSLAAEQITDCLAVSGGPYSDNVACGVNGGTPHAVLQYIKKEGRLATEESYPYCVGSGTCKPCAPKSYDSSMCQTYPILNCVEEESCEAKLNRSTFVDGLKVLEWSLLNPDEDIIAQVLEKEGPLISAVDAVDLQFYRSGILMPDRCKPGNLNHASLLVGYGAENGVAYWKVKNSWGSQFGEDGYFRIARGLAACGINTYVSTVKIE